MDGRGCSTDRTAIDPPILTSTSGAPVDPFPPKLEGFMLHWLWWVEPPMAAALVGEHANGQLHAVVSSVAAGRPHEYDAYVRT